MLPPKDFLQGAYHSDTRLAWRNMKRIQLSVIENISLRTAATSRILCVYIAAGRYKCIYRCIQLINTVLQRAAVGLLDLRP